MPTYRLLVEYDGTAFCGWQIQPDQPTVQAALEDALRIVLRAPTPVVGSGRTDSGVHARGQVAHVQTGSVVDPFRLRASLNGLLPNDIAVLCVAPTDDDFHARYGARERRYRYYASTAPRALDRHLRWLIRPAPDVAAMNRAAETLLGTHDFDAFCRAQSDTQNRVCTVREARWVAEERPHDWCFEIAADRFLHGMVRAIVGTLMDIGQGKRPEHDLARVLASRDRREAGPAAPAQGLVLEEVVYPPPYDTWPTFDD